MIFDKMFSHGKILETALKGTELRNSVIINNIANADTPGYKVKSVEFESELQKAINNKDEFGRVDIGSVVPKIVSPNQSIKTRIDGNSIDVETEMVKFYKNATKYEVIINSINSNSDGTAAVLKY